MNIINFKKYKDDLYKQNKINNLFDFCKDINSVKPSEDSVCASNYMAKYGNICHVKFWPPSEDYTGLGKRANKFNVQSLDEYTKKFKVFLAVIDKDFEILATENCVIMRNKQGEISQIENDWDYPPKIINSVLTPEVRKKFEKIYDTFFTNNLPKLELDLPSDTSINELLQAVKTVLEEGEKEESISKLTLLQTDKSQN